MPIKLIALDLDGTLLNSEKEITDRNLRALRLAHEAGVWIVPATGRFFGGTPPVVRELPFLRYVICMNGAKLQDVKENRPLYQAEIPPELADRVYAYMDTLPVLYDCYQDDWGWMDEQAYEQLREFDFSLHELDLIHDLRTPIPAFRETMRQRGRPIQKTQMFFRKEDLALRQRELERLPGLFPELAVSSASDRNIEINHRDANKGRALEELARHLGVAMEETMAFGDGLNDISMLRAAGVGVAMDNASDAVKAAADLVAPHNNCDGVAVIIEEYVL